MNKKVKISSKKPLRIPSKINSYYTKNYIFIEIFVIIVVVSERNWKRFLKSQNFFSSQIKFCFFLCTLKIELKVFKKFIYFCWIKKNEKICWIFLKINGKIGFEMKLFIPYGKIEMLINFCLLKECLAILLKNLRIYLWKRYEKFIRNFIIPSCS